MPVCTDVMTDNVSQVFPVVTVGTVLAPGAELDRRLITACIMYGSVRGGELDGLCINLVLAALGEWTRRLGASKRFREMGSEPSLLRRGIELTADRRIIDGSRLTPCEVQSPEGTLVKHLTSTAPDSNGPPNLIPFNPITRCGRFRGGSAGEDALGMYSDGSDGVIMGF